MPFKTKPPFYDVWRSMKDRCLNPRCRAFANYGGRGIRICPQWISSYSTFASDMGDRPKGWSIDRIDNDGDYTPENCRWADKRTQQRNRRRAVYVTVDGIRHRAIELAERAGVKTDTIIERVARGLSYAEVVSQQKEVNTSGLALGAWARGAVQRSKTHCPHGHSYDDAIVSKEGYRRCRTCWNAKERKRLAAQSNNPT